MLNTFFFANRAVYEIMWKNTLQPNKSQMTWRIRIACWIPNATNTHSECVILIACPLQQRLHEGDSMLRHTYIADLVKTYSISPFQYEEKTILSKGRELTTNNNIVAEGDRKKFSINSPRSKKQQQLRIKLHEVITLCSPTNRYR